ncbi:MAG: purine-nucleoside phosphorylase [Ruminococcus sp.]|nr:purine-nucleoside phosphorylase [Candidatus Copronaster equi]
MEFNYEYFKKSADYVKSIINDTPEIAIILGTGLGGFSKSIENHVEIKYEDIPNFLVSTNESHEGKLIFGTVAGKKIICMSGRFHFYEGYSFEQLVIPIRLFKLLGVQKTILTNAAGAVNTDYNVGDIMIVKDHIKLNGASPLCGKNIDEFGPRFFDTTDMYTASLRKLALECAENSPLTFREGVYMFFTGPQFETPAEIRASRILGADAVGMSTVTEAITAAHCSMPLLAFSVMTNMAAGVAKGKLSNEEVGENAEKIEKPFCDYIIEIISKM